MKKRDTITIKERTMLSLNRFRYECKDQESDWEWYRIDDDKGLARMLRLLNNAYVNVNQIVRAMQTGMIGHTPFVRFKAIRLDSELPMS
jgi:hypothetical protein